MRKLSLTPFIILLIGLLLLAGCNMPAQKTATPDAGAVITEAAATAAAELTRSAADNPVLTNTPPAAPTQKPNTQPAPPVEAPSPTNTQAPRATSAPATSGDAASFVADVTVPDGTYAAPGAVFVKTWRIKNSGTTTWTPAYGLVWIEGDKMNSPELIPVPKEVRPGEEVEISVTLTAPADPGTHKTYFRFKNASGQYFRLDGSGDLWVQIIVGLPSTSTPTVEGTDDASSTPSQTQTP